MGAPTYFRAALMCSVSISVLLASSAVRAQDPSTDGATRLQNIVIGAGQAKIAIDTPQAVTAIDQNDIDQAQPTTAGDLFEQVPGATTSGSQRVLGESFNIRGVGAGEDQADEGRFIISVDGVDKNYQQYRLGGFFSDPELYKRIEILRGPASSTLYGSGALAGSVLFVTKDASDFLEDGDTWAVRAKTTYNTNGNGFLGSGIGAWRPTENAEFLIAGNFRRAQDYEDGSGNEIDADFESFSGLAKGTFYFGDNNEQSIRASYQRWETEAENQQYAQTVNSAGFGRVDRDTTDETWILAYANPASGNDWIDFEAQISYSDTTNEERNATTFFFGPGPGVQFFPDADFRYRTLQAKAQNTMRFEGDDWENFLTVGVQYIGLERELELRNTGAQPEGRDEKYSIFAQSEFTWDEKLTVIPGVRIDHRRLEPDASVVAGFPGGASTITDTAFSPKIAALYRFNDTFSLFGSYAHTQRLPTLDEAFDYRTGLIPGNDLDKEKSNNFELGFAVATQDILTDGDVFQVKTTAFHNAIDDYIFRSPVAQTASPGAGRPTAGPGTAFVNIGDVRFYGVEIEAAYDSDNWFASFGASIIRGDDRDNSISDSGHLNTVPPDELFATVGYKLPDYGISLGWKSRFVDSQGDVFGNTVGRLSQSRRPSSGFATHGAFFNWIPEDDRFRGLEFRASVDNLFDKQYQEFLSNDPGPGRTFKFSLVKTFGG